MKALATSRVRLVQGALAGLFALIVGAQLFGTTLLAPWLSARFENRDFIDPERLFDAIEQGQSVILYDVRTPEEYAVSHLRGALRVDVKTEVAPSSHQLAVAYCSVGYRSGLFAERQTERKLRVLNLRGGIFAWARMGFALAPASDGRRRVHPFDPLWGLLLPFHLHAYR